MEFNPVIIKDLRGRMRGRRAVIFMTFYLVLISGIMLAVYAALYSSSPYGAFSSPPVGRSIFTAVIVVQLLLLSIISPISTAAAISSERERQTYDVLLTTLLSPRSIILGKLIAALAYSLLLIVVTIPLAVLSLLLGGIGIEDVLFANLVLLAMTLLYGSFGIYSSSLMRSTLGATSLSIGFVVFVSILLPLLGYLLGYSLGGSGTFYGSTASSLTSVFSWVSPPFALLDLFNHNSSQIFYNPRVIAGGGGNTAPPFVFPSWIGFLIVATLLSGLLVLASTRALRPRDRRSRKVEGRS